MAFNTKVDVADTELEANEAVAAEAEDVTLEDEALVEAESDADEDNEEADESEDSLTYSNGVIEKIVAMATREVPHVLGMKGNLMHFVQEQFGAENLTKGVTVEVTDDNRVVVNISVIIEYGDDLHLPFCGGRRSLLVSARLLGHQLKSRPDHRRHGAKHAGNRHCHDSGQEL